MIESPINYMGSKYKLLEFLLPLFPKDKTEFIDLFTGGGSVYMNICDKYDRVIANDKIEDLITIHKSLRNKDFVLRAVDRSIETKESKDNYLKLRDDYNYSGDSSLLLALIWSCNSNMMRFNKKFEFNQTHGKRCFNSNTKKKYVKFIEKDYSNVIFKSENFELVGTTATKDSFVYLDPPYSNTEAGYNVFWSDKEENQLIKLIEHYRVHNISFGLSGVINEKENKVFNALEKYIESGELKIHYLGDQYQKIAKKERVNKEYYITNC